MKKYAFFVSMLILAAFMQLSFGLSVYVPSRMGVVAESYTEYGSISAKLTNIVSLEEKKPIFWCSESRKEIGHFPDLIRKYVSSNYSLPGQKPEDSSWPSYAREAGRLPIMPDPGDIVIYDYCGFTGVYDKQGRMKGNIFDGNDSWSIGATHWTVTQKKETSNFNGEKFEFTSGQTYF